MHCTCTHIAIKAPKHLSTERVFSVILQEICTGDLRVIHCVAGRPGSCHYVSVLKNKDIWGNSLRIFGNRHFHGDGAYPLRCWLILLTVTQGI